MKYLFFLLIIIAASFPSQATNVTGYGDLTIMLTGFKNDAGLVQVGLANGKDNFAKSEKAYKSATVKIIENKAFLTFKDLPLGEYAVSAYHDKNANEKLDFHFFGMPKESYGFSNNARGLFGPPDFDKAKFTLNQKNVKISIEIQ